MRAPLDVAFVWHMHQPYYRISDTGSYEMPWVRMHALKDYADMVDILAGYPSLRQTFNLVPSLVEQLRDYAAGNARDTYREHTRRPAEDLTPGERAFLLEVMCERTTHPRVDRGPRYRELARKRDRALSGGVIRVDDFSVEEIRDLQVWFDLAWFDPADVSDGPLAELVARGSGFTEEDKAAIAEAEAALLAAVLPAYRRAADRGSVELTTSPYYHPILPLLVNSDLARVALPGVELPTRRFAHPEDAREHVRLAVASHRETFGRAPLGMWCSEQSVGEDVIGLLSAEGIAWTVSDEAVLARSTGMDPRSGLPTGEGGGHASSRRGGGHPRGGSPFGGSRTGGPGALYSAYRLEREDGALDIVFRDRELSDRIGFTYQDWDPSDAAGDLVHRLLRIREELPDDDGRGRLVTIALDGENAWEYYRNDGRDFLERLYERLSDEPGLACVTVSEHLAAHPPERGLPWLHTGSWIGGDFGTWIGDPSHRQAWDLLHDARDAVAAARAENAAAVPAAPPARDVEAAWREILIAEGSDWFWWFSEHQESGVDHVWDAAFRRHLQQAYRLAGLAPPHRLFAPILPGGGAAAGRLTPHLDGRIDPPDEWRASQRLHAARSGTMQRADEGPVRALRFGWDDDGVYFLVERGPSPPPGARVVFYLALGDPGAEEVAPETIGLPDAPGGGHGPEGVSPVAAASLGFRPRWALTIPLAAGDEPTEPAVPSVESRIAEGEVVEAAVGWSALGAVHAEPLWVGAVLYRGDLPLETYPTPGAVRAG